MKLLLIEDDAKTVRFLKKGLTDEGYVVDVTGDGESGLLLLYPESMISSS